MTSASPHLSLNCLLCCTALLEATNRHVIGGRGKIDICLALKSLEVPFESGRDHLCKLCNRKVEKHGRIMEHLKKSGGEIRTLFFYGKEHSLHLKRIATELNANPVSNKGPVDTKKVCLQDSINPIPDPDVFITHSRSFPRTSTPVKVPHTSIRQESKTETVVKVSVKWPSENYPRERTLNENFAALGKALVRGTYSQMANAIFKIKLLKVEVIKCILRQLARECADLTSKKYPSILRKNTTEDMRQFELRRVCEELEERAPLYYAMLLTSAVPNGKKDSETLKWLPSVAMAGSILLRERSTFLNAAQIMVSIVVKFSGIQALYARLCAMKLSVSSSTVLRKLDEYGEKFDEEVLAERAKVSKHLREIALFKEKNKESELELSVTTLCDSPTTTASSAQQMLVEHSKASLPHEVILVSADVSCQSTMASAAIPCQSTLASAAVSCQSTLHVASPAIPCESTHPTTASAGNGIQFVMDNFDLRQEVKDMTCDNQNKDYHWTNHNCVKNRVSGLHLANEKPICELFDLPNGSVLPQARDHLNNRENYIVLVERIIVDYIPVLGFLKSAVQKHIHHKYSEEMAQPTNKTCLGILFDNENTTEGMLCILQHIHSYLASVGEGDDKEFDPVSVIGDQLTVYRAVNAIMSQQNGYTEEERLTNLNIGIADWHADMNFLQLCFKKLYSTECGSNQNTLFCDRNKINRRNVKSDVTSAYSQARAMFLLAVKARVVAAALQILGMNAMNENPKQHTFPPSLVTARQAAQRMYLRSIAEKVVDQYVIDSKVINYLLDGILSEQEQEEVRNNQAQTPDGRYPCRVAGCNKTFRFDGKTRRKHEETHNEAPTLTRVVTESCSQSSKTVQLNSERDDMYNYQCSLLQHGLLYLNFRDAVAEGDGVRIIRTWKFFILHFWHNSTRSKYALEALYLNFQVYSLLTPRQAHQLMWNRSVNNRGGPGHNVPLDLDLEHDNNYVKEACKKLGRNLTSSAVTRICHSSKVAREVIENFDSESKFRRRSGEHVQQSDLKDLGILVDHLVKEDSLTETSGRKYQHFCDFKRSPIKDVDMSSLYKWINSHKKYILLNRRAR